MNATARLLPTLAALALALSLAGCASIAPSETGRDATLALIRHPEFPAAAQAAPGWVQEALAVITDYEAQLARTPKTP